MKRHPNSEKFVVEGLHEIAAHFDEKATMAEREESTAKLRRDQNRCATERRVWLEAKRTLDDVVMPPRDPSFEWIAEAEYVAVRSTELCELRRLAAERSATAVDAGSEGT